MAKIKPFEEYGDEYDQWFIKNKDKYDAELQALRCFIPDHGNGLEVGVGSGKFAAPLRVKIGVEPSRKMAQKAKSVGIQVIQAVAESLPFADYSFDFVLLVTTICFIDKLEKSFQEVFRVLKNKGIIIIGFIDKESELGKIYKTNKDKSHFYSIAEFFSTQEVLSCLNKAGFENFETKQTLFSNHDAQRIESGFGTGSFVVIKGQKILK